MRRLFLILLLAGVTSGYFEISNDVPTVFSDGADQQWRMWSGNQKAATLFDDSVGILFDDVFSTIVIGKFTPGEEPATSVSVGYFAGSGSPTPPADSHTNIGMNSGGFNTGSNQSVLGFFSGYHNTGDFQATIGAQAGRNNDGDNNTAIGYISFNAFNLDAGSAKNITSVDFANNRVTVGGGHGFGANDTYRNLKITSTGSLPAGMDSEFGVWLIVSSTVLELFSSSFTDAGSGTHTLTPQFVYTNSTALGHNAEPDASNQIMLGDTNVTEIKTTAGMSLGGTLDMNDNPITEVNYIDFDLVNGVSPAEGRMCWNDDDGTINIGMKGGVVNQQVGLEVMVFSRNESGSTIADGKVVRITGGVGGPPRPKIDLAEADVPATAGSIGLATEEILNNASGYVTTFGLVREQNTLAFSVGDRLYLSNTAGELTATPPSSDERIVFIGIVIVDNVNEGVIWVNPINVSYMSELSGNTFAGEAANDIIQYDGTIWENRSSLTILDNTSLGDAAGDTFDVQGITQIGDGGTTNYVDISATGDTHFVGSGGLLFGSFYGNDLADVTLGTAFAGGFVIVSDASISAGQVNNTTFQNNQELLIATAGMYLVNYSVSVEAGVNQHVVTAIGVGGAAQNDGQSHTVLAAGASESAVSGTAILDLAATSTVSIMIDNESGNATPVNDVTVEHLSLTLVQIGGT